MLVKDTIFSYPVRDLARMTDFYRDVLGFQVEDVGADGWTTLCSGHARVAIYPVPHCQPTATHLMLVVESLEEILVELNLGNCDVTGVYTELKVAKFKDPEGNELAAIELGPGRS
ncbi:MAG: VOC family protein [Armatimonadetes bacterium]|nr:VOC family protein [Armatimonadota bacterium]